MPKGTVEILDKVVTFIEGSSNLLKEASDKNEKFVQQVPATVDRLIKAGHLREEERDAAVRNMSADPARALLALQGLADIAPNTPPAMGKVASAPADAGAKPRSAADAAWLGNLGF